MSLMCRMVKLNGVDESPDFSVGVVHTDRINSDNKSKAVLAILLACKRSGRVFTSDI